MEVVDRVDVESWSASCIICIQTHPMFVGIPMWLFQ